MKNPGSHIRFTSLGYASENRTISVDNNLTLEVELAQVSNRLDEAVVTAYKQKNDPQEFVELQQLHITKLS